MISRETTKETKDLRLLVQKLLKEWCKKHHMKFQLKVMDKTIQQYEWTYLVIVPDKKHVHAYQYARALAAIETALHRDEGLENVLLVPGLED